MIIAAWHQIWIALCAPIVATMAFLTFQTYVKGPKSILFIGLYLFSTVALIAFALTDNTHAPSPPTAYMIAIVTFVVVSVGIGARGLKAN